MKVSEYACRCLEMKVDEYAREMQHINPLCPCVTNSSRIAKILILK